MKKLALFGSVVMIALVLGVAGFAGARADSNGLDAIAPDGTLGLVFDGYCDGVTINFDAATGVATGVWNSACATCPYDDVVGGYVAYNLAEPAWGFPLASETNYGAPAFFYTAISAARTWELRYFDGTLLNSGTWTPCIEGPVVPEGAVPAGLQ
jgi:hypothetical protein